MRSLNVESECQSQSSAAQESWLCDPRQVIYLSELRLLVYTAKLPFQVALDMAQIVAYAQHHAGHLMVTIWSLHTCPLLGSLLALRATLASELSSGPAPAWVVREGFLEYCRKGVECVLDSGLASGGGWKS